MYIVCTCLYIEAWSEIKLLVPIDKDSMTKRHMDIYADMSASPLFAHQGRIHNSGD